MRIAAQFRPDLAPYEAFFASLRLWLVELVVWLADIEAHAKSATLRALVRTLLQACAPRIRADLRASVTDVRQIFFLRAFMRFHLSQPTRPRPSPPLSAPAGFRRQRARRGMLHRHTGGALSGLHAGSLRQRAARLKQILDNPEPYITRIVAHLARFIGRFRATSLVAVAPPPAGFASAAAQALAHADTS